MLGSTGRVDAIIVCSEATYFKFVQKYKKQAGEVLKKLITPDGYVFFVVPRIKTCKPGDIYCLDRKIFAKERPKQRCSFRFPNAARNTPYKHIYCEYDDIILYLLITSLKDDGDFSGVSLWSHKKEEFYPQVRLITSDKTLFNDALKSWRMVHPKLKELGTRLSLDMYAPNREAYGLDPI